LIPSFKTDASPKEAALMKRAFFMSRRRYLWLPHDQFVAKPKPVASFIGSIFISPPRNPLWFSHIHQCKQVVSKCPNQDFLEFETSIDLPRRLVNDYSLLI